MKKKWIILVLILIIILIWLIFYWPFGKKRPSTLLRTASGIETTEFQMNESILFDAIDLEPMTGYTIQIAREDGMILTESRLSSDQDGHIPETIIWYNIGLMPCPKISKTAVRHFYEREIYDTTYLGKVYTLNITLNEKVVRETSFQVAERLLRPMLYAADSRGCLKSGFLIGEEDVWVVGSNFPKGSIIRLWAVPTNAKWEEGDKLEDITKFYGVSLPPIFELVGDETGFKKLLWTKGLTSIGSYDIVAEVITYPFGNYCPTSKAQVQNVVSNLNYSGFVIQRRQGVNEPLEMNLAGVRNSRLAFRDAFLTNEHVYIGVDPYIHPTYIGTSADVYIVVDKTDAQWTTNTTLSDVTGFVEHITIQPGSCANCYSTRAWTAPLTIGDYDVVLDIDQDGVYTPGVDLIDGLDQIGFTVTEVRVNTISFNHASSGAVTIYDNVNLNNISPPEYSTAVNPIKPAAWIMGNSYSVVIDFKAVSGISSADIWAVNGMGGLNSSSSPITVNFSGGTGQGTFNVNSLPTSVGKYTFLWDWKYSTSGSTLNMGQTGEHLVYLVLETPVAPPTLTSTIPPLNVLDYACTWASGSNTREQVCLNILSNGFSDHYTWNMDCHRLASDFSRMVSTQGISAAQHRWASKGYSIDDMSYQRTNAVDPVGPTWGYGQIDWSWHQWAQAEGAQRDPAAAATLAGNWGAYEDHLFAQYKMVTATSPYYNWVNNQPGQNVGCEHPNHRTYTFNPTLYGWRGPDR